jgi:cell division control protein 45
VSPLTLLQLADAVERCRADAVTSKFGLAFQEAAEESGAGAKHDMFDTSVVEVLQNDLTPFIESLHLRSA